MSEGTDGKRFTIHGGKLGDLMGALTNFFTTATDAAEEFKWLCKAGAQLMTTYLEVRQHPEVKAGLRQVALMQVREAQSKVDTNRNRRDRERKLPAPAPRHENREKVEHKRQEILSGKPVEVEKELKNGTSEVVPEPRKDTKKGLTHRLPQKDLQAAVTPKEAAAEQ